MIMNLPGQPRRSRSGGVYTFTEATPNLDTLISFGSRPGASGLDFLLPAVKAGRIALTVITDNRAVWTPRQIQSSLPNIVVISDDDDAVSSRDPDQWRCAISAIAWARSALIHGAVAERFQYQEAIQVAVSAKRMLVVETGSAFIFSWCRALKPRRIPTTVILPRPGHVHPLVAKPTCTPRWV